jgi:hypothetical protein
MIGISRRLAAPGLNPPTGFNGIYVACFVVFLTIALLAQLIGLPWRSWFSGSAPKKSLLKTVRGSVYSLMSHIP